MSTERKKSIQEEWSNVSLKSSQSDDLVLRTNSYFSQSVLMFYKAYIIKRLNPRSSDLWLDVCCGGGPNSIILALNYDCRIVSFDISFEALRHGQKMKNHFNLDKIDFINADVFHLPFRDDIFDGAIATQSFSYYPLTEQKTLFNDLFPLIKKNGTFLLSDVTTGSKDYYLFNIPTYRNLLHETGFSIVEESGWGNGFYMLLNKIRKKFLSILNRNNQSSLFLFKMLLAYNKIMFKVGTIENHFKKRNNFMFHILAVK
jgi:ubiquinone/menaquinone biosynthesis C-methylase UbiE